MLRFAWVLTVCLVPAFELSASPCVPDTLANYEALGATGCTIGSQTVNDFSFSVLSIGGGAVAETDTHITVTPVFGVNSFGVVFSSTDAGFSVTTGFVNYLIGYTWDSLPIRGMDDVLDPGDVNIVTDGCVGAPFTPSCAGTPVSVTVNPSQLTDSVFFPATLILGIANHISLNADQGTASFTSLENDVLVNPEPASFLLAGLGMALLAARIRSTATNG
jgi:hypothetical protein